MEINRISRDVGGVGWGGVEGRKESTGEKGRVYRRSESYQQRDIEAKADC